MTATAESPYVIAELKDGEPGGFSPRGAVKTLWKTRDFETIVSGPAETGKTWGALQYADALLWRYPGAQGVMTRKTYASLIGSAVRTYLRILGPETPVKVYGGEKPQWFDYPNGSRLWVVGMDNPGKALSSERDFIYVNQAEELLLEDWETLMTRATGRGAVMPYTRMFGDCNPGPPHHWIKARQAAGKLVLLESRHGDNPTLYDDAGKITPQGERTMSVLQALTGLRKTRLLEGKWGAAEGLVYENYDPAIHVVKESTPMPRRVVASVDWGFTNAGVIHVYEVDGDGRMYLVHEVYRSRRNIDWWVEQAKAIHGDYRPEAFACDPAEPGFIQQFQIAGLPAIGAYNDIEHGTNAVRVRLEKAGDGKPRLYFVSGALKERDEMLEASKLPLGIAEEIEGYVYPKGVDGKPVKETPMDLNNHACDTCRYAVAYVDGLPTGPLEWSGSPTVCV